MSGVEAELLTKRKAHSRIALLLAEAKEALAPHENIKGEDPQYEDPDEWWLRPLISGLEKTLKDMEY